MGVLGLCMLCMYRFVSEKVSEALGWFDPGAGGTAGLMYSVGMVKSE